jgi:hypothetical protein
MRFLKMKLFATVIGILALCLAVITVHPAFAAPAQVTTSHAAASSAAVSENCSARTIVLSIKDNKNGRYCFSGTGYIGYRIVSAATFTSTAKFWVRIYPDNGKTGCFLNVAAGTNTNKKYFNGKYTITQIALSAVHAAPVCA